MSYENFKTDIVFHLRGPNGIIIRVVIILLLLSDKTQLNTD